MAELEVVPDGEGEAIRRIIHLVLKDMRRDYASTRPVGRGQHPKSNGCVKAKFTVKEGLPDCLAKGLFAAPGDYEAWVRFSGSAAVMKSDTKSDAHGMSIKVMGVPGRGVLRPADAEGTQDFVMVNHETFFLRDAMAVADFAAIVSANASVGHQRALRMFVRAVAFFLQRGRGSIGARYAGLRNLSALVRTKIANPLEIRYWSQTPFALGPFAVKYSAEPTCTGTAVRPRSWDGLEEAVAKSLKGPGATFSFNFCVQRQSDPRTMPVEDPTISWKSKPETVATVVIGPDEDVLSPARRALGERMTFSPWNAPWEQRPLGGINRVRQAVYAASGRFRHELNNASTEEPTREDDSVPGAQPETPPAASS